MFGQDNMRLTLSRNLLLGLYNKIPCRNYTRNLLNRINLDDCIFRATEENRFQVAIGIVR